MGGGDHLGSPPLVAFRTGSTASPAVRLIDACFDIGTNHPKLRKQMMPCGTAHYSARSFADRNPSLLRAYNSFTTARAGCGVDKRKMKSRVLMRTLLVGVIAGGAVWIVTTKLLESP